MKKHTSKGLTIPDGDPSWQGKLLPTWKLHEFAPHSAVAVGLGLSPEVLCLGQIVVALLGIVRHFYLPFLLMLSSHVG